MTRQQIADAIKKDIAAINRAFTDARKEHPELDIDDKTFNPSLGKGKDYTLEQVLLAMSYFRDGKGMTELEKIMIEDEFTMRPIQLAKAKGIPGTEEFLERLKNRKKLKCCATCIYCLEDLMEKRAEIYAQIEYLLNKGLQRYRVYSFLTISPLKTSRINLTLKRY